VEVDEPTPRRHRERAEAGDSPVATADSPRWPARTIARLEPKPRTARRATALTAAGKRPPLLMFTEYTPEREHAEQWRVLAERCGAIFSRYPRALDRMGSKGYALGTTLLFSEFK
jgi:hypothetical protein